MEGPISLPHENTLSLIGNTPMVELTKFDTGPCRLFAKLESANPGGSIKDRPALYMINAAKDQGLLKPGGTIVEATAGNTGLGLALVANQMGYKLLLVLPDKMSQEKIYHLKAVGAEVVMTRSDVQKGHPEYYQDLAATIVKDMDNAVYINQFANEYNVKAHYETTGPEIVAQMQGEVDAVVCGVGTGGTLTGVGRCLQEQVPGAEMVLADPKGSILDHYIKTGDFKQAGSWLVEGIGEDFIPGICDISLAKAAFEISDRESFLTARELLKREGILGGSSSGTTLAAALKYCQQQTQPKNVVFFVCDSGNKYFSKMYNDLWMRDQGFLKAPQYGDLRDLITKPHWSHEAVSLKPDDKLLLAYNRMRLYDISQLPVLENGELVGLLDESDLLLAISKDKSRFEAPVASAMTTRLEVVNHTESVDALTTIFNREMVAIVVDDQQQFLGIITRIDLINYLKRQMHHL